MAKCEWCEKQEALILVELELSHMWNKPTIHKAVCCACADEFGKKASASVTVRTKAIGQ